MNRQFGETGGPVERNLNVAACSVLRPPARRSTISPSECAAMKLAR